MTNPGKRVLVTGGAGFIGSELVRQLVDEGCSVIVVDNLINGRRENLAGLEGTHVELVVGDIRDIDLLEKLLHNIDLVFHLACLGVRHSIHSPLENHHVNATATLGMLSSAMRGGVKRLVFVSSSEVYGTARWAPMTEEHPTFPTTVYGSSKLAGECYCRAFNRTYDYPTVIVRPFNTYGPRCHHEGDSGEVIPKFMLRGMAGKTMVIFGDGTQTRDFTYVSDTASGILRAGFTDRAVGHTVNLGSGQEIAIGSLAGEVMEVLGRDDCKIVHQDPRPGDVHRLCADTSKARELFGYAPQVKLSEGLLKLMKWYLDLGISIEELLAHESIRNWERDKAGEIC